MISLQNECTKYEKLFKMAPGLPTEEELEERLEKALNKLSAKDEKITVKSSDTQVGPCLAILRIKGKAK